MNYPRLATTRYELLLLIILPIKVYKAHSKLFKQKCFIVSNMLVRYISVHTLRHERVFIVRNLFLVVVPIESGVCARLNEYVERRRRSRNVMSPKQRQRVVDGGPNKRHVVARTRQKFDIVRPRMHSDAIFSKCEERGGGGDVWCRSAGACRRSPKQLLQLAVPGHVAAARSRAATCPRHLGRPTRALRSSDTRRYQQERCFGLFSYVPCSFLRY